MYHFYDFEVFQNLWTVVILNPQRRMETVIVNDPKKLEHYYNQYKDEIFIGYNSRAYDQWIFKAILCGFNPKELNDWIIVKQEKAYLFSDMLVNNYPLNNYDVFIGYNGLKTLEAFMGSDIRETTIPFDYDGEFTPAMIEEVVRYNRHDVEQTMLVFMHRKARFDSQVDLLSVFDLPRHLIGKTQAQLAAVILGARPVETDDEWDIRIPDSLRLTRYRHIADWFLDPANHDDESYLTVDVAGVEHIVAWGGLHAAILQYHHECGPDEVLLMADVDQLYPHIMKVYRLLSRAVHEPEKFYRILDKSMELKRLKLKKKRQPYKDICNIAYGAMGDRYNKMYDPLHRRLVCVFGQLLMIDLIEKIEGMCQLVQSNTDGILVRLKRADMDRFKAVVGEWEDRTGLHMSFTEYVRVHQKDVNNYLAVEADGKVKAKGAYVKDLDPLDNDLPIVNRAVRAYLVDGTHPRETVMECDDLMDFQKVVKVSSKYSHAVKVDSHEIENPNGTCKHLMDDGWDGHCEKFGCTGRDCNYKTCPYYEIGTITITDKETRLNDRTFRVFASKRPYDGMLKKVKSDGTNSQKFANTPKKCFMWNESVNDVPVPSYLDREWYVDLAVKRLNDFGVQP